MDLEEEQEGIKIILMQMVDLEIVHQNQHQLLPLKEILVHQQMQLLEQNLVEVAVVQEVPLLTLLQALVQVEMEEQIQ